MADPEIYDVAILGAGPAGLSAALYTSRDRYSTLVLEKNGLPGGQIMLTERIENYPGWESVGGPELIQHMVNQVQNFGTGIRTGEQVTALRRRDDGVLEIETNDGETIWRARAIILAPGSDYRQLGAPGEAEMRQLGKVSYCATCDGAFYRDKHVLTIGGGNTAVEDTLYLATRFARKVTMIHRRLEFRAQRILQEELLAKAEEHGIDIRLPYVLDRIVPTGDHQQIDYVEIRNVQTNTVERVKVDGVFVFVGMVPNTAFLEGFVDLTEAGYIEADPVTMRTKVPGVFVAGDCRAQAPLQLATACGDGVTAAMMLKPYFRDPQWWTRGRHELAREGW